MWSISNLKNRGKEAFKRNYWKCVLIGLLVSLLAGGAGGAGGASFGNSMSSAIESASGAREAREDAYEEAFDEFFEDDEFEDFEVEMGSDSGLDHVFNAALLGAAIGVIAIIVIVIIIVAILLDLFVNLPLEVGTARFFFKNQKTDAKVAEVAFAYDNCWKNIAVTMFLRNLFTFLWSLLLIIPGIVKAYEYRMIPYILAENPDMNREEVFALSKKMMDGEKWHAFVLDLSFIGWHILGAFTAGILEVFYVVPYQSSTNATLYEALKFLKINRPQAQVVESEIQSEQTDL